MDFKEDIIMENNRMTLTLLEERNRDLENKLYGTCEMIKKIDLLIMRQYGVESETFKKLREIEKQYSEHLGMCLA